VENFKVNDNFEDIQGVGGEEREERARGAAVMALSHTGMAAAWFRQHLQPGLHALPEAGAEVRKQGGRNTRKKRRKRITESTRSRISKHEEDERREEGGPRSAG
jgi:hypothetical protein